MQYVAPFSKYHQVKWLKTVESQLVKDFNDTLQTIRVNVASCSGEAFLLDDIDNILNWNTISTKKGILQNGTMIEGLLDVV